MLTFLLLILFFTTSQMMTSYKPPLQVLNYRLFSVEQMDTELNCRSLNLLDLLKEELEINNVSLTLEEENKLIQFENKQQEIIDSYKTFYLRLIEEHKNLEFNRSKIIYETILSFRKITKEKIDTELENKIKSFKISLQEKTNKELEARINHFIITEAENHRKNRLR